MNDNDYLLSPASAYYDEYPQVPEDPLDSYEEDPLESERQAQWEEEAHYWHTVMAFVDLIEQHGYDKIMADVSYTIDRREADKAVKYDFNGVCPKPDLSFMSIRKE